MIFLQETRNQLASSTTNYNAEKKRHIFADTMTTEKIDEFMTIFAKMSRGKT